MQPPPNSKHSLVNRFFIALNLVKFKEQHQTKSWFNLFFPYKQQFFIVAVAKQE
jgi:hypothetical protein